jgi:hypothetical protein
VNDISELLKAYGQQLESMIHERLVQLTPLDSGDMRVAYRLEVMNAEWMDNTAAHALKLRTEVAGLQAVANHIREIGGTASEENRPISDIEKKHPRFSDVGQTVLEPSFVLALRVREQG